MSTPPQQTYLARTFDDGRYAWARTRTVRRRAVVAEAALLGTLVAATLLATTTDAGWTAPLFDVWTV